MEKNKKYLFLFLLFTVIFFTSAKYCLALEVPLPGMPDLSTEAVPKYIAYFFKFLIGLGGALAAISLAFSGIQFIMSAENPSRAGEAKSRAIASVLGLVLLLSSYVLLGTINPELQTLQNTEGLQSIGGLQLTDGDKKIMPAPSSSADMSQILLDYSNLDWPKTIKDLNGKAITNCKDTDPFWVVYWYKDANYTNFYAISRIQCGKTGFSLSGAKSYIARQENPGVYFSLGKDCEPPVDSGLEGLPKYSATSIPEWNSGAAKDGIIKSVRIVNGPDPKKGPFFGVIWFNSPDYNTGGSIISVDNAFTHLKFSKDRPASDNYSNCIPITTTFLGWKSSKAQSWVIYKWAGLNPDGTLAGDAKIDLYTGPAWTRGTTAIYADDPNSGMAVADLKKVNVNYFPDNIPKTEKDYCKTFDPAHQCLKSFKIRGNTLVLASLFPETPGTMQTKPGQVFPISQRLTVPYINTPGYSVQRGTPSITDDYIQNYASYLEIIPLAENLVGGQ